MRWLRQNVHNVQNSIKTMQMTNLLTSSIKKKLQPMQNIQYSKYTEKLLYEYYYQPNKTINDNPNHIQTRITTMENNIVPKGINIKIPETKYTTQYFITIGRYPPKININKDVVMKYILDEEQTPATEESTILCTNKLWNILKEIMKSLKFKVINMIVKYIKNISTR